MFNDKRSKRVIFIAHCLLNQNSISDGTADLPSQFGEIIDLLMRNKIGIIQLPCPELLCLGLDRHDPNGGKRELLQENTRIRNLMVREEKREILTKKAKEIINQIEEYKRYDFEIVGIIGVNRSPSCGIDTTTINAKEQKGRGIFIQIIEEELNRKGIKIKMTGTKTSKKQESIDKVKKFLDK